MYIEHASAENLIEINRLIARSKSYWMWPEGYLEAALPMLNISGDYLAQNTCFEVVDSNSLTVAFFSLSETSSGRFLDHLWVDPTNVGQGVGKLACEHAFCVAGKMGWAAIKVLPDPPSEAFYKKMGFYDTGGRIASRVKNGPVFGLFQRTICS